ncbi:hypothetical protein Hanom_Chr15g01371041 [Helianthus anomalus]
MWGFELTKHSFYYTRRHLAHLFSCRRLQMWSADCRPFTSEKTNTTLAYPTKYCISRIKCSNYFCRQIFSKEYQFLNQLIMKYGAIL